MAKQNLKLIIGNWKMHGCLADNAALLEALSVGVAALPETVVPGVCVPFPYLAQVQAALRDTRVAWGVQDVSGYRQGAYTGEVSAAMAAEFGARFAIIGHSERRAYHCESDELVAHKARQALEAGLTPIVCVGETLAEHDGGATRAVVARQLQAVLGALSGAEVERIVVAYEPIWAIGTGKSASAHEAQAVHAFLRAQLAGKCGAAARIPLLYGGSMKPDNAQGLFLEADIDGGLVGGASLQGAAFLSICAAAQAAGAAGAAAVDGKNT